MKINIFETENKEDSWDSWDSWDSTTEAKDPVEKTPEVSHSNKGQIIIRGLVVIIPEGTIEIQASAFKNNQEIEEVILPDSVETIGRSAFSGCKSLKKINCPKNLRRIEKLAFYECKSLKSFNFPDEMGFIDNWAFCESGLESIKLPSDCSYGDSVFENSALKRVEITGAIGWNDYNQKMFNNCTQLEDVIFNIKPGNNLNNRIIIPDYCFAKCYKLRNIDLNSVAYISNYAFSHCYNLKIDRIPKHIGCIGKRSFEYCTSLAELTIEDTNALGHRRSDHAFSYCCSLKKVVMNVLGMNDPIKFQELSSQAKMSSTLSDHLFHGCSALESVTFTGNSDRLESLGKGIFAGTSICNFEFPRRIRYIEEDMFAQANIKTIKIPETISAIKKGAFYGSKITSIEIPDYVGAIKDYAFASCHDLENVKLSKNIRTIPSHCFYCCDKLSNIENNSSIAVVKESAFNGCKSLESFDFSNIERIEESAFAETGLKEVIFSDKLNRYGDASYAFSGCSNLETVDFSACLKIKVIAQQMFEGDMNLKNVKLSDYIEHFRCGCFRNTGIKEIYIPESTRSIGPDAFCTPTLKKITFDPNCGIEHRLDLPKRFFCKLTVEEINISDKLYERNKEIFK